MYPCRVIPFPATQRSVLERIRNGDAGVRQLAFGDLAQGYWKPSYHYLRLHWRLAPETAEDAVQAFFTVAFEKSYLERFDPAKAKFRTFLRVCLDRFVQNLKKAESAERRGGGSTTLSLDFPGAERELDAVASDGAADLDRFFHDETVRFLFARAVESLRQRLGADGRGAVYRVFELHDLQPTTDTSYATVAAELGLTTSQVTNYLHAARRIFRELALEHLRSISATHEEFRREALDLFGLDLS